MLAAGETIVRVTPKLMAHARDGARTYGRSDPIDALAVARAALREPDLSTAHLDDEPREVRLLVDQRLVPVDSVIGRVARDLIRRIRELAVEINALSRT